MGYMSVRTAPDRAEIREAEVIYRRRFRQGQARGLKFHQGLVLRSGWRACGSWHRRLPLAWRAHLPVIGVALGGAVLNGVSGVAAWAGALLMLGAALLGVGWLQRQVVAPVRALLGEAERLPRSADSRSAVRRRLTTSGASSKTTWVDWGRG